MKKADVKIEFRDGLWRVTGAPEAPPFATYVVANCYAAARNGGASHNRAMTIADGLAMQIISAGVLDVAMS